jgi:hypothetical protein
MSQEIENEQNESFILTEIARQQAQYAQEPTSENGPALQLKTKLLEVESLDRLAEKNFGDA